MMPLWVSLSNERSDWPGHASRHAQTAPDPPPLPLSITPRCAFDTTMIVVWSRRSMLRHDPQPARRSRRRGRPRADHGGASETGAVCSQSPTRWLRWWYVSSLARRRHAASRLAVVLDERDRAALVAR